MHSLTILTLRLLMHKPPPKLAPKTIPVQKWELTIPLCQQECRLSRRHRLSTPKGREIGTLAIACDRTHALDRSRLPFRPCWQGRPCTAILDCYRLCCFSCLGRLKQEGGYSRTKTPTELSYQIYGRLSKRETKEESTGRDALDKQTCFFLLFRLWKFGRSGRP